MKHTLESLRHKIYREKDDELLTYGWNNSVTMSKQVFWLWCEDELATQDYIVYNAKRYMFVGEVSQYYFEEQRGEPL